MGNLRKIRITGLTGQSGAGKSTVRDVFEQNGFAVVDCDAAARKIASKKAFLDEIAKRFGSEILNADGTLDRAKTAAAIYGSRREYDRYCGIIFPYIIYAVVREIEDAGRDVLLDAPTLFESGIDALCSEIICVVADVGICAERISRRDNSSPEKAMARLSAQHDADFFIRHSDYVIENNGTKQELYDKALAVIDRMKGS